MADPIGTIITSAGNTMIELLNAEAGFADGDIVMKSPADADTSAKVSMFLFQVNESPHLRNRDAQEIDLDGLRPAPLALDLYYLITPLAAEPATSTGHLESIMRVFYDYSVLQEPLLPPAMLAAGNELVRLTPHSLSLEDTNRLWSMFPNKPYYLSVTYLLSPVLVPSAREIPITRVVEKTTRYYRTGGAS